MARRQPRPRAQDTYKYKHTFSMSMIKGMYSVFQPPKTTGGKERQCMKEKKKCKQTNLKNFPI